MAFLTPDKIRTEHGLIIKEKIIPWGTKWKKKWGSYDVGDLYKADRKLSNGTGKVEYITIHNTNDIEEAKGTNDAEQYTRATFNQNMGDARVHYFIDETDCWQLLREDEVGWHAGDGRGDGNETTIGVEIIMSGKGDAADKSAEDRGALLAAILLNRHGLSIDRLVTHQKWKPAKKCPMYILPHWNTFKASVEEYLKKISGAADTKEEETTVVDTSVKNGDLVSIASNATYYSGKVIPSWVKNQKWYVKSVSGDRAVIDKNEKGTNSICSAINVKYLSVEKAEAVATIKKGSTVKVKTGAKTYTGGKLASFVYKRNHKVREIKGNRAVITFLGIVVAAVNVSDLILVK